MDLLGLLVLAAAVLLLVGVAVPVAVVALQVASALTGPWPPAGASPVRAGRRVAVLMPAHNESRGLVPAVEAVLAQLGPDDRLLVVADNCTDDTAVAAREAGAYVVERVDPVRRGKGHALAYGLDQLRADPPDVVMIVDADCIVSSGAVDAVAAACLEGRRPVQALYLMRAPGDAGLKHRVAAFAWRVKNLVRPYGASRMGWPCQLMGTGMALPWEVAARAEFATSHLVEDMKLGIECALAGAPPLFVPQALVTSEFPDSAAGMDSQRTRWEHGHLDMLLRNAGPLLWRSVRRGDLRAAALALDLAVPPLTMLVLAVAGASVFGVAVGAWTGVPGLVMASGAIPVALTVTVLAAWARHGRDVLPLVQLIQLPIYVLWKLPIYFRFLVGRQVEWIRTRRREER
ncbi:MAG: glycosyltransferase family 2 protein [Ideonella sp.]|nr:glycosyltransferase family 2 protein [Ideonella sp.]